jgi:serine/threonine-protein kinase
MSLAAGARLGPYEITAPLGAGGMGEVYRARDPKLNRNVALKILPASFAADPDRLARFKREAHVLASLNHPNIAAIYGFEDSDDTHALVLELVEGRTLADRITKGPIPLDEALPIAKQIAEALEAAHDQGIVHRDLKPANIKVREDGTVKVLDFGLAKAMEPGSGIRSAASAVTNSPTITSPALMTGVGVLLGTAAYMSPEQAKGKPADKRSDVWAFGAVLYEMLTGTRAFDGDDMTDVLGAVVRLEPDWSRVPAAVPPAIRTLLQGCLVKDRGQRVGDIAAVRFVLQSPALHRLGVTVGSSGAPRRPVWQPALLWAVSAIVVAGLAAGTVLWMRPVASPARVARFVIPTSAEPPIQLTLVPIPVIAISRDGSRLVYRMTDGESTASNGVLYQRGLGQVETTHIPGTEGANGFFFSPDGTWVGFSSGLDNTLKRVPVAGGPPQTICALDGLLRGASWGPDDTIVFATTASKGLRRVPAVGGHAQVLTTVDPTKGETDHFWPETLPDGKGVIFTAWNGMFERSRIVALSFASGQVSEIVRGGSQPHLSPSGHLVYAVGGGTLNAVRFNAARLAAIGDPAPVIEGVSFTLTGAAHYALAGDGSLTYVKGGLSAPYFPRRTLVWVDRQGQEEAIKVPPRAYTYARLSPDGTRVALDARDQQNDIWIWDLARGGLLRLTTDPGMNRSPVWTPDGMRVAFTAEREGVESIYWQKADASGVPERLSIGSTTQTPESFSPDGTRLVFGTPITRPSNLGILSLDAERREKMLFDTNFLRFNGEVSPDGHWLAYASNESGEFEVYLAPFPDITASKRKVSTGGGTRPLWSRNGRELFYYLAPDTIMTVPVRLGTDVVLGTPQAVVKGPYAIPRNVGRHYDVSPDGKRFLLLKDAESAASAKPVPPEIVLVQHWAEELKAKLPAGK